MLKFGSQALEGCHCRPQPRCREERWASRINWSLTPIFSRCERRRGFARWSDGYEPAPAGRSARLPVHRLTYHAALHWGVLWLVMKQPMTVSGEQLKLFTKVYPMNARPVQAPNGRLVREWM